MAVIVDPDNLDRNQVIFGANTEKISLYPVGNTIPGATGLTSGSATGSSYQFYDVSKNFISLGVTSGHVLITKNKQEGHWPIYSVQGPTTLNLDPAGMTFSGGMTSIKYEIRGGTGGSISDGVSLQAIYSFAKEEWISDSDPAPNDNLIRHTFPFEAITSEQFEIGGGASHDNWEYFNDYTRKKIRTGGWARKNSASSTTNQYTGIVTLGSLDSDTQVYYQQTGATHPPSDFTFEGTVNEPLKIYSVAGPAGSTADYRYYLKLFARKKAKTYAQSAISDIGVSTIQTIVNRFPLSHLDDPAIASTDGAILGSSPFRNQTPGMTATNGSIADVNTITGTLTSSGSTFLASRIVAGDSLIIQEGTFAGKYFTILSVDSETQITVDTSEEGPFVPASNLDFTIHSTIIHASKINGLAIGVTGTVTNVSNLTGTISAVNAGLTAVSSSDLVMITNSIYQGIYPVITKDSSSQLTVNTSDKIFSAGGTSVNFMVVEPGMYLQYKHESITIGSYGTLTFNELGGATGDTLFRDTGSWVTDGVTSGTVLTFNGTASNDGSYTVSRVFGPTALAFVSTDDVAAESTGSATVTAYDAFKRTIGGKVFSYHWKITGNNATLSEIYEFIQHQLRQSTDIDYGPGTNRGDVTSLLMSFSTPTGTALDLIIDDLSNADFNNATYRDSTGVDRNYPFQAAGTISFNSNLTGDANAKYWLFFSDISGYEYGTANAIIVKDTDLIDISGNISAQSSIDFSFDYDNNSQGNRTPGTDANVTLVALGLDTAQFVIATGTITRSTSNTISAVASLERNYSNP